MIFNWEIFRVRHSPQISHIIIITFRKMRLLMNTLNYCVSFALKIDLLSPCHVIDWTEKLINRTQTLINIIFLVRDLLCGCRRSLCQAHGCCFRTFIIAICQSRISNIYAHHLLVCVDFCYLFLLRHLFIGPKSNLICKRQTTA